MDYTADDICKMTELLIDNILVQFEGCLFRQVIVIPMGRNCAPSLAHMRRYKYIDDLIVFDKKKFLDCL